MRALVVEDFTTMSRKDPSVDEVWRVLQAVWESMLALWPRHAEPGAPGPDWLAATVAIDGPWHGSVALSCSPRGRCGT